MQMIDGLAAFIAHIGDDAIAPGEAFETCDFGSHSHKVTEESFMLLARNVNRIKVLFWHHQHMHRRFGADVGKGVGQLVLVDGR